MENCGDRIAALRRENGMTQEQLGKALYVSAQAVSKWERNLSEPDIGSIRGMASLFGLTIDYLLGGEQPEEEEAEEETDEEEKEEDELRVVGVCTECGKELYDGEAHNRNGKDLCTACLERVRVRERQAAEIRKLDEAYRRKVEIETEAEAWAQQKQKYDTDRRLKKALIIAGVVAGLWLIVSIVSIIRGNPDKIAWNAVVTVFDVYLAYAIVFEFALPNSLLRKLCNRLIPKRHIPKSPSSGCLGCLLFYFFGGLIIAVTLLAMLLILGVAILISAVTFPIDLHRAVRDR